MKNSLYVVVKRSFEASVKGACNEEQIVHEWKKGLEPKFHIRLFETKKLIFGDNLMKNCLYVEIKSSAETFLQFASLSTGSLHC